MPSKKKFPPKSALRLLEWFCPAELHEGIVGDLTEQYETDIQNHGIRRAKRKFFWNTIRFLRPGIILRNKHRNPFFQTTMFKNYLKIAFRSLWRSKAHSFINVFGLSLGIACCILIALFAQDEFSFDRFHQNADRIYRVFARENWGENEEFFYTVTPFPMGPALKENFPEVERQVRILKMATQVKVGDNLFNESLTIAGQDFFSVFDFEIIHGAGERLLNDQNEIVLSEDIAKKYFGDNNPVNKILSVQWGNGYEDFTVSAIAKVPSNSSIQFSLLVSDLNFSRLYNEQLLTSAWFNVAPETYVMLSTGTDPATLTFKFPSVFKTLLGEATYKESRYEVGLQPFTSIHLDVSYPQGIVAVSNPKYVYILLAVSILILIVACINFVTLSLGRSLRRAKEVGIRKVVGAVRSQLVTQFIGEAMIVASIAVIIGLILAAYSLPFFNDFSGKQLVLPFNGFLLKITMLLLFVIGLIAGSYPAFVLSKFLPLSVLKGSLGGSSKSQLRKVLVGIQFIFAISLISSALIMRNQLLLLQNKDLGFNQEQLAVVQLKVQEEGRLPERISKGFEVARQFKMELAKIPGITAVGASSHDFANGSWTNIGFTDDNGTYRTFNINTCDADYIPTLKIQLMAGRNFSDDNPADKRRAIIVNEALVKQYGWADAIGKKIPGKKFLNHEIISVIKDFNYASLYTKVEPLVLVEDPAILLNGAENISIGNSPIPKLMIRLRPGDMQASIGHLKSVWGKLTAGEEFDFAFVDQALDAQYKNDQNLGKIVQVATALAVIIASLGLYALATLALQNRTKEISIRKVMGASEKTLFLLLSKEYVFLSFLCLLFSIPATWYLMSRWLSSFAYQVTIGISVFVLAGAISLVVALVTISYQTLKTVYTNPVKSLKYE